MTAVQVLFFFQISQPAMWNVQGSNPLIIQTQYTNMFRDVKVVAVVVASSVPCHMVCYYQTHTAWTSACISACISHSEKAVIHPACETWASVSPWTAKVEYMNIFLCIKTFMFWPRNWVIRISLEAADLWIEPRDRSSTLDQWASFLLDLITRHFYSICHCLH